MKMAENQAGETFLVRRTCTRQTNKAGERVSCPLEGYRELPAYVLLGDPGAGKTSSFKREAEEAGGEYVRARDFAIYEWEEKSKDRTLFIDGLDEMPAMDGDRRNPLDRVRERLVQLGRPSFRISCREADWLGDSDREALKRVSPDGEVVALHLDPLSSNDIGVILQRKPEVGDAEEFMRRAHEHGLEGLLTNPQALNLLVEAVGGNEWPQSRTQVYELASNKLVTEKNPEHIKAQRERAPHAKALLDAAGYLSAVQLLSGVAGFALDEAREDTQHPCWNKLEKQNLDLLSALKTNLFQSDGEELRAPTHRSVAEFLGARYLAALINDGLPLGRVLALLTGEDGGVVTDLRGLAAWLAVHSMNGRSVLIERDPLGVVLYGDVRNFPKADKMYVLEALGNEARNYPWFRSSDWASSPFGALGSADMETAFHEIISSPSRDEAHQSLLDCVLDAIRYGNRIAALAQPLEAVVRDASYKPVICQQALGALMHVVQDGSALFLKLASDIQKEKIEDGSDEMLGMLLNNLYPHSISPEVVLDYLHAPKQETLVGVYLMFWIYHLSGNTPCEKIPALMDRLASLKLNMHEMMTAHQLHRMTGTLLVRAIEEHGDTIPNDRLYTWLGVGLDEYDHPRLDSEYTKRISAWFAARPERYKAIIEHGASQCVSHDNPWSCMSRCLMRMYGAAQPADIGMWFMKKAASDLNNALSQFYFDQAVQLLRQGGGQTDLTLPALEFLESWVVAFPKFQPWLEPFISQRIGGWEQEHKLNERKWKAERHQRKSEWIDYFRKHISAIRDGSAHPRVFHDLAQAHEGLLYEAHGDTPAERLADFLDDDQQLIEAAYSGFRKVLDRADLPSVDEIVKLELKGKMHFIRPACLLGMEMLLQGDPVAAMLLPEEKLSRLMAFRLSHAVGNEPAWVIALAKVHPGLVADVLLAYALPMLRAKKEHVSGLSLLLHNDAFSEVAHFALPKLLEGFPLRAKEKQLSFALDPILRAAFQHLEQYQLTTLIESKLKLSSMDAAQRVYWLACGQLLAPSAYETKLFNYIGNSVARRNDLAKFLHGGYGVKTWPKWASLPESTLGRLIELLAPGCSPDRPTGAHWVSPAMQTADMLSSFINTLSNAPEKAATHELERLLELPDLAHWHNHLRHASHNWRITRRKATFKRLGVAEIGLTLANLQPASAADLAALVYDCLGDIASKIRHGNTNDYRQYWSYDESNIKLVKPKPENECRNALLSDLQQRLEKLGVDAQPEGNYADEKRADIQISFGGGTRFNVPVEIKKDSHIDLWHAIHEQLIPRYVRDPGADGYGIYLVFWFGGKGMRPP